jgi:galactokinase
MDAFFEAQFGRRPTASVAVPGRVNLLGEWIDFCGGLVLPMALPLEVRVAAAPNGLSVDRIASAQFAERVTRPIGAKAGGCWSDYVAGALEKSRTLGWLDTTGMDVAIDSAIPHGSGLSSSAAVIVATLRLVAPVGQSASALALAAKAVENDYIGVPCGIMDQMAVAIAEPGMVLALDTGTLAFDVLRLPASWHVSVVHSGVSRQLADGRYGQLRAEILEAARQLEADYLVAADLADCPRLSPRLAACARHVVTEHQRTQVALACIRAGDLKGFGQTMREGQRSISSQLGITTPEVDAQVALMESHGAIAARQTGGGFGGCIVVLDDAEAPADWWPPLAARFPQARLIL